MLIPPTRSALIVLWPDGSRQKMTFSSKGTMNREAKSIQREGRGIVLATFIESEKNYEEMREVWDLRTVGSVVPDLS